MGPSTSVARGVTIPGIQAVRSYQRQWLPQDVVAGLVLASLLVPQGMAYAELAGLPAITGLYTSILCLVAYAIFGPSRILVLGPDSALGPMIAATILPLAAANGDPGTAIMPANAIAFPGSSPATTSGVMAAKIKGDTDESGPSTSTRDGPKMA